MFLRIRKILWCSILLIIMCLFYSSEEKMKDGNTGIEDVYTNELLIMSVIPILIGVVFELLKYSYELKNKDDNERLTKNVKVLLYLDKTVEILKSFMIIYAGLIMVKMVVIQFIDGVSSSKSQFWINIALMGFYYILYSCFHRFFTKGVPEVKKIKYEPEIFSTALSVIIMIFIGTFGYHLF